MQTKYVPLDTLRRIASEMPTESRGAFLLSMQTGVRITDALCAKAKDFDKSGFFHYKAHKTGKSGRAFVTDDFIKEFVNGHMKDDYIFQSRYKVGRHVTRQTVFNHIKKACFKLAISPDGVAPHTARKAFAVDLFRREGLGKTMHALQHRDVATTLLYALSDDSIVELSKRLEKIEKRVSRLDKLCDDLSEIVFGDDVYIPL